MRPPWRAGALLKCVFVTMFVCKCVREGFCIGVRNDVRKKVFVQVFVLVFELEIEIYKYTHIYDHLRVTPNNGNYQKSKNTKL